MNIFSFSASCEVSETFQISRRAQKGTRLILSALPFFFFLTPAQSLVLFCSQSNLHQLFLRLGKKITMNGNLPGANCLSQKALRATGRRRRKLSSHLSGLASLAQIPCRSQPVAGVSATTSTRYGSTCREDESQNAVCRCVPQLCPHLDITCTVVRQVEVVGRDTSDCLCIP